MTHAQNHNTNDTSKPAADYRQELQDFVYIVSHDLQAPIRHLTEFTKLLTTKAGDQLDDNAKTYLRFIQNAAQKLNQMQDVLLAFSRVVTHAEEHRTVDIKPLAESALAELKPLINDGDSIEIADLPAVCVEPNQIRLVFYHLLKNALTYHEPGETKHVTVTAETQAGGTLFTVTDNGIGIKPEHYDTVFQMFRRLHAPDEYGGGTGAGLTLARRIIDHHGGKIWLEPGPARGTGVLFFLPG